MPTKKDIKRLLKKGLTGEEAARLVIQDSWEVDNLRPGFLSTSELRTIIDSLPPSEGAIYNKWINTYRIISFTLKEAHIQALKIQIALRGIIDIVESIVYSTEYRLFVPVLMTQKQYDEMLARQKEYKLAELVSLYDVLDSRSYELASQEPGALDGESPEDEPLVDGPHGLIPESYILDKWQEASSWLFKTVQEKEISLYWNEDSLYPEPFARTKSESSLSNEEWNELIRSYRDTQADDYQSSELFAKLKADTSSISDEEMDEFLQSSGVSVADLYEIGIPEWVEWVDAFTPGYDGEEPQGAGVAILKDPKSWQVDERGYYDSEGPAHQLIFIGDRLQQHMDKKGRSLEETLAQGVKKQKKNIKEYLAFLEVIGAVSEIIGVDMTEGLKEWYREIENSIQKYLIYNEPKYKGSALSGLKLPPIRLASLKPTPSSVEYLRERMAISLGEDWLSGEAMGEKIGEALEAAEFPEDSDEWEPELAEEVSDG